MNFFNSFGFFRNENRSPERQSASPTGVTQQVRAFLTLSLSSSRLGPFQDPLLWVLNSFLFCQSNFTSSQPTTLSSCLSFSSDPHPTDVAGSPPNLQPQASVVRTGHSLDSVLNPSFPQQRINRTTDPPLPQYKDPLLSCHSWAPENYLIFLLQTSQREQPREDRPEPRAGSWGCFCSFPGCSAAGVKSQRLGALTVHTYFSRFSGLEV